MDKKQRLIGPDIIRCIAVCSVLFIHMLSYAVKFNDGLRTPKWCVYVALHYFVMICVPLFLMLTGFFSSKKKLSKAYYAGLLPVLISYLVIAAGCIILRAVYGEQLTILRSLLYIFNFTANDYAWYVEMYIGLFLIIPFLNMAAQGLQSKRQWHALIAVLLVMTALPEISNSIILQNTRIDVIPDYWTAIYPITYYFIGAYIARFRPKIKKGVCALLILLSLSLQTAFCYAFSTAEYAWWVIHGFGALPVAFTAYLVFLLFCDIEKMPAIIAYPIRSIAVCSFEMYLLSYVTDKVVYKHLPLPGIAAYVVNIALCFVSAWVLRLVLVPLSSALTNAVKRRIA